MAHPRCNICIMADGGWSDGGGIILIQVRPDHPKHQPIIS